MTDKNGVEKDADQRLAEAEEELRILRSKVANLELFMSRLARTLPNASLHGVTGVC